MVARRAQRISWKTTAPPSLTAAWAQIATLPRLLGATAAVGSEGSQWKHEPYKVAASIAAELAAYIDTTTKDDRKARNAHWRAWGAKSIINGAGLAARYAKPEQPPDLNLVQKASVLPDGPGPPTAHVGVDSNPPGSPATSAARRDDEAAVPPAVAMGGGIPPPFPWKGWATCRRVPRKPNLHRTRAEHREQ